MLTAPQTQRTVPAQIGLLERPCSRFALLTTLALLTCPQFLHFQISETFWLKKKFQVGWLISHRLKISGIYALLFKRVFKQNSQTSTILQIE